MTKAQRLNKAMDQLLKEAEVIVLPKSPYQTYQYTLKTRVGPYRFKVEATPDCKNKKVVSVFGRFKFVDKAKKMFNCNPFSGKYNFHYFDIDELFDNFHDFMERATGKEISMEYSRILS